MSRLIYKRRTTPRKAPEPKPMVKASGALNQHCPPPMTSAHTSLHNCCLCNLITRKQILATAITTTKSWLKKHSFFFFLFAVLLRTRMILYTVHTTTLSSICCHSASKDSKLHPQAKTNISVSCCHTIVRPHAHSFLLDSIKVQETGQVKGEAMLSSKDVKTAYMTKDS